MEIYLRRKNHGKFRRFFYSFIILFIILTSGWYFLIIGRAADYKSDVKIQEKIFGYSEKGRPVSGYEIGKGSDVVLLFAAIHGDEIGTADLLKKLAEKIKIFPGLAAKTKKIIIIPILNPDGYYDRTDKLNANEVNLNINFSTAGWREYGLEGTFAGQEPFSEKESQIIRQIVLEYKPMAMISYHSRGAAVSPEAGEASAALAGWYGKETGYGYYSDENWDYPGTATKWFVETTGKPALTVEISKQLQDDWEVNRGALIKIISSDGVWY